jgi:superfamily II DNA or RNA helicase/HKD family nuclease/SOS-response transcriptional repressor LexA
MPFPTNHLTTGDENPFIPSLLAAINYATDIRIAVAFVRLTGLRLVEQALFDALARKANVKILTGDYLDFTDPVALRQLMLMQEKGAEIRVFESFGGRSFHMKTYIFTHRQDNVEEGCAFVGSSNLTSIALRTGLEWNLRVDKSENEARFTRIEEEYNSLFMHSSCKPLTHQWIDDYSQRQPERSDVVISEAGADELERAPEPNDIQEQALAALTASRAEGYRRGLVVMATGLGKTWLAAFDSQQMKARRILFVAHREEILTQAEATFVRICPNARVGSYNGNEHELNVDMLFASVQTLGKSRHLENFSEDFFDYIIVDEFHHAAASTYQRLLQHFSPKFLLGLTATPDRTDQSDILSFCDDNLVFQSDLFAGIESGLLCPFEYRGIADVVDYTEVSWRNGKFDPNQLYNQLATQARAKHSFTEWQEHRQSRTLAFCISKKHADFMADYFVGHGVKAVSVHSDSETKRNDALTQLEQGEIEIVFSVDLFNEGVDLPSIDTVLMLRPTESKIVFLQQLGRGLRISKATKKERLIVLDFIGNHVSFFKKPEALLEIGVTNKARSEFIQDLEQGNLELPEGCFINYDLESIDFMKKLTETRIDSQQEIYRELKNSLMRRPTLVEFYRAAGSVTTIRRNFGHWFNLVKDENDLNIAESVVVDTHEKFFEELEKTNLTKSFKIVLMEAYLELDGFSDPPTTIALANKSFEVFQRRRTLLSDLPDEFVNLSELPDEHQGHWHSYWKRNPISAWIGGAYFSIEDNRFIFRKDIQGQEVGIFNQLVWEIVNYRFAQYESRLASNSALDVTPIERTDSSRLAIPFFTDLKIACGHFAESSHADERIEHRVLPERYGNLNPARSFIAQAKGNSMDGGKTPIADGDYLLCEVISSESAGSLNGSIAVIERQDFTGDDQFLLRRVNRLDEDLYELIAQNPDYEKITVDESMIPRARFKQVVSASDLILHQSFLREDIPPLFGMEFNTGLWQSGHIRPKGHQDQYLFVTINKQGRPKDHQYHDYFIDESTFHWQSQDKTGAKSAKGKAIVNHLADGSSVHLFVRRDKLERGKGAPFYYCGTMTYQQHEGERPMSVTWKLDSPLSLVLFGYFR